MIQNSPHIEFERIADLIGGMLAPSETAEINAHLLVCSQCANLKMRAETVVLVMQSDRLEEVPTHILERTFDLLRERKMNPVGAEKTSFVKRIAAVFKDESTNFTPAFGLRSGQTENTKRFWLEADGAEIDLRLGKTGEMWKVSGQIFGDFSDGEVVLKSETNNFTSKLGELCEFSFAEIPTDIYKIIIQFENLEIELPPIDFAR